jgi:AmmeMemoRadiSam system protein B
MPESVRQPAVAGLFYPSDPTALAASLATMLGRAEPRGVQPKALIAPHAGYVYSGPVAASAYSRLLPFASQINRVVLLGPSHYVPFRGLAASSADCFETPLGRIELDAETRDRLLTLPQVTILDAAHAREHSLEVHLPFLQTVLSVFRLLPLAVGDATAEEVAEVLETAWGDERTLLVISSDLSHYHDYETARRLDAATRDSIERLDAGSIRSERACGSCAVNGLLEAARRRGLQAVTLDLRSSGDTAGPRDQVVGYGAWAFVQSVAPAAAVRLTRRS